MIYVDVDGVLAEFVDELLRRYNRKYGTNIAKEHITDWQLSQFLEHEYWDIMAEQGFWESLELTPLAHKLVDIIETKYPDKFAFLTSLYHDKTPNAAAERARWLKRNFGSSMPSKLVVANHKGLVAKPGDIIIDDAPHHVTEAAKNGAVPIVVDQPWNKELYNGVPHFRIKMDSSMEDIIEIIEKALEKAKKRTIPKRAPPR